MAQHRKRSSRKPNGSARRQARPASYPQLRAALEACGEHIDHLTEIDRQVERVAAERAERERRDGTND